MWAARVEHMINADKFLFRKPDKKINCLRNL